MGLVQKYLKPNVLKNFENVFFEIFILSPWPSLYVSLASRRGEDDLRSKIQDGDDPRSEINKQRLEFICSHLTICRWIFKFDFAHTLMSSLRLENHYVNWPVAQKHFLIVQRLLKIYSLHLLQYKMKSEQENHPPTPLLTVVSTS